MQERISIIVPLYNGQDYIEKCLQSIINQTYKNLEIIVVNDGSSDNSLKIINKLKIIDERIVIIDKENNEGVSSARNTGIDKATSDWIMFVDGDDILEKDAIENLSSAISEKIDIVLSKIYEVRNNKKTSYTWKYDKNTVFNDSEELIRRIFYENQNGELNYIRNPFARLYRKQLLEQNNINFPENIIMRRRRYF